MRMHNPPHPGSILKEDVLPELNLSVTDAAAQLGVSRVQFSRFINGRAAVTPELAIRLSKWIPAPTAIMWLQMQADYDLWQVEHSGRKWAVEPAHSAAA
jgi:addiction module HigA family antidote